MRERTRSRRAQRRSWAAVAAISASVALGACGTGTPRVNLAKAEPALAKTIATSGEWYPNLTVGKVTCPASVERKKGLEALCTVEIEGQRVELRVVQTDNHGGVAPKRVVAVLSASKAEDLVRRRYSDIATISCGKDKLIVRAPNDTFSCDVTSSINSRSSKVTYRVLDVSGNVKWVSNT